jgi:heat shock protein HslJ
MTGQTWRWCFGLCALLAAVSAGLAQESEFPVDGNLILDVRPMAGSKRVPIMTVVGDGKMALQMWCNQVDGQLVVAGDTITVVAGTPTERSCPPERVQGDTDLLETLAAVTNWKRQGDVVQLLGPKTLRFRVPTN